MTKRAAQLPVSRRPAAQPSLVARKRNLLPKRRPAAKRKPRPKRKLQPKRKLLPGSRQRRPKRKRPKKLPRKKLPRNLAPRRKLDVAVKEVSDDSSEK